MKLPEQKMPVKNGLYIFGLLAITAQLFLISDLMGQTKNSGFRTEEIIFTIIVEQTGISDDVSYSSVLEKTYAPCSQWVGGSGGFTRTPSGFISNAGGLGGLKPKMGIPFYSRRISGSAKGSDGSTASVVPSGDGLGFWTEQRGDSKCTDQDDPSGQPSSHMSALFERTEKGARITFDADIVSAGCATYIGFISVGQMEVDPALVLKFCTFEITNEELNNWKQIKKKNTQIFSDDNGRLTAVATLSVKIESPIEVEVEIADYDDWMPKGNEENPKLAGNTLNIKASVKNNNGADKDKEVKVTFTLNNVSNEPGICINGPKADSLDMKFLEKDNPTTQFEVSQTRVKTINFVKETNVVISSFDFGAYADLSVTAMDRDGKPVKVILQNKERNSIFLPKAEMGGIIADAWRIKEKVAGLDETWDEAEVSGQKAKGDGLDLYAKYRGVLVIGSSGTPGHTRLTAREKVHFVIDKSNIFDFERWYQTSGIRAYKVNEALTSNRQVDYNSTSASHKGGKYAVKIENIRGLIEMDPMPQSEEDKLKGIREGDYPLQYGYLDGDTPRKTERCRVFQDRIKAMLGRVITKMRTAIDNPEAAENAEEIAMLNSLGRSLDEIRQRLIAINDDEIKLLTDMMLELTAIHEMGHACGIDGHLNDLGQEDETLLRSPSCPMNYLSIRDRRLFILDRALGGEGRFCSKAPDNCWEQLNVK